MAKKTNYIDNNGNYINVENLSLKEIYLRASQEGYKKGYTDASLGVNRTENISEMADYLFSRLMRGEV